MSIVAAIKDEGTGRIFFGSDQQYTASHGSGYMSSKIFIGASVCMGIAGEMVTRAAKDACAEWGGSMVLETYMETMVKRGKVKDGECETSALFTDRSRRLYLIDSGFNMIPAMNNHAAIGSGSPYVEAVLAYSLTSGPGSLYHTDPRSLLMRAISVAIMLDPDCGGVPQIVEYIPIRAETPDPVSR
jgi:hypothetical protein